MGHHSGKLMTICLSYGKAYPLSRYEIYLNIGIYFLKVILVSGNRTGKT
jgi:hypothetical protein